MSLPIAITFDITDDVAARAAREHLLAIGRDLFSLSTLALVGASAVIFVVSLRVGMRWLWLALAGTAPALLVLMMLIWAFGLWWIPRAAKRKLQRLPHRHATIELTDPALIIATANERFELKWAEVSKLEELPHFFVIVLHRGSKVPVPREAASAEAIEWLQRKLTSR